MYEEEDADDETEDVAAVLLSFCSSAGFSSHSRSLGLPSVPPSSFSCGSRQRSSGNNSSVEAVP